MKIYVTRHGEVSDNVKQVYSNKDNDLNETGINQANVLKSKFNSIDFDVIYCSPTIRTVHTAKIINGSLNKVIIDKRLIRRDPGEYSGVLKSNIDRKMYWNYNSKLDVKCESLKDFSKRIYDFIDEVKNNDYNNILIVAHSSVAKVLETYFNGMPKDGCILGLGLENCEVKQYTIKKR